MTLELSKAKALCEAATCLSCSGTGLFKRPNWTSIICSQCGGSGVREEFAKAARSLVPALIAECERLREEREAAHAVLAAWLNLPSEPTPGDGLCTTEEVIAERQEWDRHYDDLVAATLTALRSSGEGDGNG